MPPHSDDAGQEQSAHALPAHAVARPGHPQEGWFIAGGTTNGVGWTPLVDRLQHLLLLFLFLHDEHTAPTAAQLTEE
jgi:hypothetical protein